MTMVVSEEEAIIIADEILREVKRRAAGQTPIWTAEVRPGFRLSLYQDRIFYDWLLLDPKGTPVGAGELLQKGGEVMVKISGMRESVRGQRLYQDVLRALGRYFAEVCTDTLDTVTWAAQRAWRKAGGKKERVGERLFRYCLRKGGSR